MSGVKKWLITGAAGAIGLQVIRRLFKNNFQGIEVVATDVRALPDFLKHPNLKFQNLDIRSPESASLVSSGEFHGIIHLASIVSPGKHSNREFEYSVDVLGTKNILEAAVAGNVKQIIVTSSGAAYGYHKNLPEWIPEDEPVVGNEVFAYSWHKKCVEEMMASYRQNHPELKQLILRPGTILGDLMKNQITDLFEKPAVIGITGSDSPFVFIWDQDVAEIIYQGMIHDKTGIFNLAGDGKVTNRELAQILKKPLVKIPAQVLGTALSVLKKFNLTQYGPDQIDFLRYRPVLDNKRLKNDFGFRPTYSSREVLLRYLNPEKKYLVLKGEKKFSPLNVFIESGRLDDLFIEDEKNAMESLQEWHSFFEGQRSGKIHIVDQQGDLFQSKFKDSPYIDVLSRDKIETLKNSLAGQKNFRSI
jgi:UDP-glucose 4-epimerase